MISVIGGHKITSETEKVAFEIGKAVAEERAVLICGGLDGAMQAASKGAKAGGGLTVGILS